jgi:hypothetical protein
MHSQGSSFYTEKVEKYLRSIPRGHAWAGSVRRGGSPPPEHPDPSSA